MILLAAALVFEEPPAYPAVDLARAELCYAHALRDIRNSMSESGRVPGPAWFIRDWWLEQALDNEVDGESERPNAELVAELDARAATDPDAVEAEGVTCAHQAMDSGALP